MVVSTLGQLMPLEINVKVSFQELIDLEEISSPWPWFFIQLSLNEFIFDLNNKKN